MTKEEVAKRFPIGSKARVVETFFYGHVEIEAGHIVTVVDVDDRDFYVEPYLVVESDKLPGMGGWFHSRFEPIEAVRIGTGASVPTEQVCPRCGGRLAEKKVNASLFSDEVTTVKKCERCGWC